MQIEPQPEHAWLMGMIGNWTFECTCDMGPDQPPAVSVGSETVRAFGNGWVLIEGRHEGPNGPAGETLVTLGFDPARARYVGTFVGTMMSNLWVYDGVLDTAGHVLTLDTEGPSFSGDGTIARYQDIITYDGGDTRTMTSRALQSDGSWLEFLTVRYRRSA